LFTRIIDHQKFILSSKFSAARNLINNIFQVGFIYSFALLVQFFYDVVFGRLLSVSDYGQISFILQTITLSITFTFLGIDSSLIRVISRKEINHYKWKKFVIKVLTIFIITSAVISLIIKYIYSLSWVVSIIICACGIMGSGALIFSALLRANSNFFKAQLSMQFGTIVLGICAFGLLIFHKIDFLPVLVTILVAYIFNIFFSFVLTKNYPEGIEEIPLGRVFSEGFLFWINSGTLLLTSLADQLVIVKLLGYAAFAPYVASWNIIGVGFILVSTAIGFVIVPPLIQHKFGIKSIRLLLGILIFISLSLGLFLFEFAAPLIKLAYGGKYSPDSALVLFFIAVGITRLIYMLPSAIITAWGTTRNVGEFSIIGTFGVLINIIVAIILIPRFNIIGAVMGSLSGWIFRLILGFVQSARIIHPQIFDKANYQLK
jgi:O-antigen/teichoic acid export membrane protein